MKFAYLIMGDFNSLVDRATIKNGVAQIVGVANVQDACETAKKLAAEGVQCIELCGAFNEFAVRQIIEATNNEIPIGYVTHLNEQDEVYAKTFASK